MKLEGSCGFSFGCLSEVASSFFFWTRTEHNTIRSLRAPPSPPVMDWEIWYFCFIFLSWYATTRKGMEFLDAIWLSYQKKASSWNGNPHTRKFEASACVCRIVVTVVNTSKFSLRRREIPKYSFTNYLGIEYLSLSLKFWILTACWWALSARERMLNVRGFIYRLCVPSWIIRELLLLWWRGYDLEIRSIHRISLFFFLKKKERTSYINIHHRIAIIKMQILSKKKKKYSSFSSSSALLGFHCP